mgnify:CR=1 FL=1
MMEFDDMPIGVNALIFNDKNQMLIQKRNSHKKLWPGLWDVSVGGSVITGESSSQAAARETFEELGISLDEKDLRAAFTINFNEGFDDCYLVEKNISIEDVVIKEDEVSDVRWATKEEILNILSKTENGVESIVSSKNRYAKALNCDIDELSVSEVIDLIQENPRILKSPILIDDKRLQVGYKEDDIRAFLPRSIRNVENSQARMRAAL